MKHLTEVDLRTWLAAITHPLASSDTLLAWLDGPLKVFFPHHGVILAYGELVAGQMKITHMLESGHDPLFIQKIPSICELTDRGSIKHWLSNRQPFFIDPKTPSTHTSAFEIEEIERFGLRNIAGHGVINIKGNAGSYFSFCGVKEPMSEWHLEALRLMAPMLNALLLAHLAQAPQQIHIALDTLTLRQKSIVRYVVAGMDDKTIARALGVSEKTVRNQLTEIYARLGVHKRARLITLLT
ncbi:MAG: helix-turn-helix transcriptional regulator [Glaciimonas sp.]|nr:helix-turn-helix transcriptional regulator [Glaciimonas sp.]